MDNVHILNNMYTNILNNISTNFSKIFKECLDGNTFLPPVFNTTSDIDALIVLNQVLFILCQRRTNPTVENIILYQSLIQIVNIKCKEYVEQKWNKNLDGFMSTFETYINGIVDNIIKSSQQPI